VDGSGEVIYDSGYALVGQIWDLNRFPILDTREALRACGTPTATTSSQPTPRCGNQVDVDHRRRLGDCRASFSQLRQRSHRPVADGHGAAGAGVTLLLREQNAATVERECKEQEARVSGIIRRHLLPRQIPMLPGWSLAVHYQPTRMQEGFP